jgi:hypothetical protein
MERRASPWRLTAEQVRALPATQFPHLEIAQLVVLQIGGTMSRWR